MAQQQEKKKQAPRNAFNKHRKNKYQTYKLVKQERCDLRHIKNLVKHNRMSFSDAVTFWQNQKARTTTEEIQKA